MKKGRMIYVPPVIIDEIEDLQKEECIDCRATSFKKLVEYARVGREVGRIVKLDFSYKPLSKPISNYSDIPKPFKYTKKSNGVVI